MDIESYIKDLSPELQEKARACKSADELLALAKESSVAIPGEALSSIAGGRDSEAVNCESSKRTCPKCGGTNVICTYIDMTLGGASFKCLDCGYSWFDPDGNV